MILIRQGDLFDYQHQALAQGVSSKGKMGAGIAVDFKQKYPEMFKQYSNMCASKKLKPGDLFFYNSKKQADVFNLVTQKSLAKATESFLDKAVQKMFVKANSENIGDIAMGWIGCGLGGLSQDVLIDTLGKYFSNSEIQLTIYE